MYSFFNTIKWLIGAVVFITYYSFQDVPFMLPHATIVQVYGNASTVSARLGDVPHERAERRVWKGVIYPASRIVGQDVSLFLKAEFSDGRVEENAIRSHLKVGGDSADDGAAARVYLPPVGLDFEVTVFEPLSTEIDIDYNDLTLHLMYYRHQWEALRAMPLPLARTSPDKSTIFPPKGEVVLSSSLFLVVQFAVLFTAWAGAIINEYRSNNQPDIKRLFNELTDWGRIKRVMVLAFGWPLAGFLGFIAAKNIDPSFYSIINAQSYVLTALLTKIGFGRQYTVKQWVLLSVIILLTISMDNLRGGQRNLPELMGLLIAMFQMCLNCCCNASAEFFFRSDSKQYTSCHNVSHVTLGCIYFLVPIVFIASFFFGPSPVEYGFFGGPHFGWDWRTVLLMLMTAFQVCFGSSISKNQGAVTRYVLSKGGGALSFFVRTAVGWDFFTIEKGLHVLALTVCTVVYSMLPQLELPIQAREKTE